MEENFPEVKGMSLCIEWDEHSAQQMEKTNYIKWLTFQNHPDSLAGEESEVKVSQTCPTLCDLMNYTVHGILQARILEWVGIPFSRGSSQPRDQTQVSCTAGRFFTSWAIREAQIEKKRSFEKDSKIHFFFSSSTPLWNGFYISYNHLQTCKSRCPINYTKSFKLRLEVKKVQYIANVK